MEGLKKQDSTDSLDEMDEWNLVSLQNSVTGCAGSMDSSCEFVAVVKKDEDEHDIKQASSNSADLTATEHQIKKEETPAEDPAVVVHQPSAVKSPSIITMEARASLHDCDELQVPETECQDGELQEQVPSEPNKDEELRRLMDILQARVRNGSPSSVFSADSDFVHIPTGDGHDTMETSTQSAVSSRFNIVLNREEEREDEIEAAYVTEDDNSTTTNDNPEFDDDAMPDADDRAESDILAAAAAHETEGDNSNSTEEDLVQAVNPIRHYRHLPNSDLNTLLTTMALTALGFAFGIAIGHSFGSAREAHLQEQIQEGQRLRLRSVQDDLLMCLRKQEDIDSTITKLNEIENILVDAEHWRNEYEELLKLKLQNEEQWRTEKSQLQSSISELEKLRDQLMSTKSCAHDNEFLSRQETTLNSVHEKLEARLIEKDKQIEQLQVQATQCRIDLSSKTKMLEAYQDSNEDKSLVILGLKEQILQLERELFDIKVTSDTPSVDSIPAVPTEDAAERESQHADVKTVNEESGQRHEIPVDTVMLEKLEICEITVEEHSMTIINLSKENQALNEQVVSLQNQIKMMSNGTGNATNSAHVPCINMNICDQLKVNMTSAQVLQLYNASKESYKSVEAMLLAEWRNFTSRLFSHRDVGSERSQYGSVNGATEERKAAPMWESMKTKDSVTQLMAAVNQTWQELKSVSGHFVGSDASDGEEESKLAKSVKKMNDMISEGLQTLQNGINDPVFEAATFLADLAFDTESHDEKEKPLAEEKLSQTHRRSASSADNENGIHQEVDNKKINSQSATFEKSSPISKKFESRLEQLRKDLKNLDIWRVGKMKKYEREVLYEKFDDFKDDYSYLFNNPDFQWVGKWAECQKSWWKKQYSSKKGVKLSRECYEYLMPWQTGNSEEHQQAPSDNGDEEAGDSWIFQRAEEREFQRNEPDDWYWRRSHARDPKPYPEKQDTNSYT